MRFVLLLLVACSSQPAPITNRGGSAAPPPTAYTGDPDRGPCNDAHECKLRNNCGCACEGVALSAKDGVACDESCPNPPNICEQYTVICELSTHQCSALAKAP